MTVQKLYRLVLLCSSLSFGYITYRVYSFDQGIRALHFDILAGAASAPWQYRFLPHLIASFAERFGLRFYMTFALIDLVSLLGALFIFGRFWLAHSTQHTEKSQQLRDYLHLFILIGIIQYWLLWAVYWHQVPYTLPSLLYVALALLLYDVILQRQQWIWTSAVLLVCTLLQITIRADIAFVTSAGFALYFLVNQDNVAASARWKLFALSASMALLALAGQTYFSLGLFSYATYGGVAVVQLLQNLSPIRIGPFLLYIVVYVMAVRGWWFRPKSPTPNLFTPILYGSLIHLLMWITLGIIDETRIFIPLSLPLAHYAAQFIYTKLGLND